MIYHYYTRTASCSTVAGTGRRVRQTAAANLFGKIFTVVFGQREREDLEFYYGFFFSLFVNA